VQLRVDKIKGFFTFLKDVYRNRQLIGSLTQNDIKSKNAGLFFGRLWIFFQPVITILVLWFVFQVGFKNPPVANVEFILWFIPGYLSWIYFNDAIVSSTGCFYEYNYLVKKVKFRTSILPIVKVLSASIIHLYFIGFIFLAYLLYGHPIKLIYFQVFYYYFALFSLLLGLSWIVSSISVFIKDFAQMISVILQIGFWFTPVLWNIQTIDPKYVNVFKLNPMYYIVQGYRDTFVQGIPFWQRPNEAMHFWIVSIIVFVVGALAFKKLRPHFADLL
jgi:ABC-type polysaccharide/polyol phosphate export permease